MKAHTLKTATAVFIFLVFSAGFSGARAAHEPAAKKSALIESAATAERAILQDQSLKNLIDRKNAVPKKTVAPAVPVLPWFQAAGHVPGAVFGQGYSILVEDNAHYFDTLSVSKTMESRSSGYTAPAVLYSMNKKTLAITVFNGGVAVQDIQAGTAAWKDAQKEMLRLIAEAVSHTTSVTDKSLMNFAAGLVAHAGKTTSKNYSVFSGNSVPYYSDFEINRVGRQLRAIDRRDGKSSYALDLETLTITVYKNGSATNISYSDKAAWKTAMSGMTALVKNARAASTSAKDRRILKRLEAQLTHAGRRHRA